MAVTTARAATATTDRTGVRAASRRKPRFSSVSLAALLLFFGFGRGTGGDAEAKSAPAKATEPSAGKLTAKQFVLTLYNEISEDRVLAVSAGVTYYTLFALFPAITALVSIYGMFANIQTVESNLSSMSRILPGGAIQIIGDQMKRVASTSNGTLGLAAIIGIVVALWSANAGIKAMFDALNVVLEDKEKRGFIRLNAISLAFTLGGIVLLLLAAGAVVAIPAFLNSAGWGGTLQWLVNIGRWPLLWLALLLAIAVLYRFGPSKDFIPWRWITWGSVFASIGWLAVSILFSWYAANFGTFNKTYGSLGGVIGFMLWTWLSVVVILAGAELNEVIDRERRKRNPASNERPDSAAAPPHPGQAPAH